jgi:hypothetical protein
VDQRLLSFFFISTVVSARATALSISCLLCRAFFFHDVSTTGAATHGNVAALLPSHSKTTAAVAVVVVVSHLPCRLALSSVGNVIEVHRSL